MSHRVVFDNAPSDWNEALPLGNGVFGGMAHYCGGQYHLALNHYEIYYTWHQRYSQAYQEGKAEGTGEAESYRQLVERALQNTGDYTREGFLNYRRTIWPEADVPRQAPPTSGVSMPPTGEVDFAFAPGLEKPRDYRLCLDIENAFVQLELAGKDCTLTAETRVLQGCDAMVTQLCQTAPGLLQEITLRYPQRRGHEGYSFRFYPAGKHTVLCEASFYPLEEDRARFSPFRFVVAHRLEGAVFELEAQGNQAVLHLTQAEKNITLVSCVLTELSQQASLPEACARMARETMAGLAGHIQAHQEHWQRFFGCSSISLPDAVLEKLWYLNLYVLACSSGKNGKRYEQASGLNGLWDVRQPTIWGSLWYWDVNIEASYWPVYTANHLELAEVFNEGFLSYAEQARRRAQDFYEMKGYAIDYPHEFYNCMWPWCAQYLWWYYEYSGDKAFLREKAYPMFLEQARFIRDVVQYDAQQDCWYFFPDVSPEQGPITRNSVITVSTVKYLLQAALEANRILDAPVEDALLFRELLAKLPPYPTDTLDRYGRVLRDSEWAPAGIELRHPSLLMPIYPLHELGTNGSPEERALAENTVFFASENTELGVFPFGWISAAAARLGMGNMALRVLYEQGLDLILRANGLGAEETDRWINFCAINSANLYYPFMMECVGEIVNCVNEMLLQSYDGIIRVFPAVPNGTQEARRMAGRQRNPAAPWPEPAAESWPDCHFERLLAKGGFAVSANMAKGRVDWISIHSLRGGRVRLSLPGSLADAALLCSNGSVCPSTRENGCLVFETEVGQSYQLGSTPVLGGAQNSHAVNVYTTHLGRQCFIGKHRNTDTIKLMDSFLHEYYVGNERYQPVVAWRFNFGQALDAMVNPAGCPAEIAAPRNASDLGFIKVTPANQFSTFYGYGFAAADTLQAQDEQQMDYLLRDCIEGNTPNTFLAELPKGRYDVLVISGGKGNRETLVQVGGTEATLTAASGEYRAEVFPVVQKADGLVEVKLRPAGAGGWRLNLMVVRKLAAYM